MGCDIHMHVEIRNLRWHATDEWMCADYFSILDPTNPDCKPRLEEIYGYRNYALFAVLADVRNGGYPCISYPKGLPDDACPYVKEDYESWRSDAHSCSYLTLGELVRFQKSVGPVNDFGYDILEPLIVRLKQRADEFNLIYNFEWDGELAEDTLKKMEDIRIVFWFDN